MAEIGTDILAAASLLRAGELVAIPTETVYGLAGNAFQADVVAKIFEVKNRPSFDPLIIHVSSMEQISSFTQGIPEPLFQLASKYWPGPLTILLPRTSLVPDLVTSGLDTVAVRIPDHPLTQSLLSELDFPLAAPSANPFGYISPTNANHVNDQLGKKISYILDGGPCSIGLESTIVGMEKGNVIVYRLGGLDISSIEQVVGKVKLVGHSSSNPLSPGMLKSHYSPSKKFILGDLDELVSKYLEKEISFAVLSFQKTFKQVSPKLQVVLSPTGDLTEAAKNLFAGMRVLDSMDVSVILSELMPSKGLGLAINDRLKRASAQ